MEGSLIRRGQRRIRQSPPLPERRERLIRLTDHNTISSFSQIRLQFHRTKTVDFAIDVMVASTRRMFFTLVPIFSIEELPLLSDL